VRFNFQKYTTRKDKYGFTRQFHHYLAEAVDENQQPIADALTKGGRVRAIDVNLEWEFFKAQQREKLSNKTEGKIYARRKIDVESVFGHLKAYLRFTRFTVRGNIPVKRQMGFMLMAMNLGKAAKRLSALSTSRQNKWTKTGNLRDFQVLVHFYRGFVTDPPHGTILL
jgi:transposase